MIFFIILLLMLTAFIFVGCALTKKIYNPITIINMIYIVWLLVGRLGYLGQFKPSYESSLFIQFNILIIDMFIIMGYGIKSNGILRLKKITINSEKIFKCLRMISFLISIAVLFRMVMGLLTGTLLFGEVRNISYSVAFDSKDYEQIYYNSVVYYSYQYLVRGFAFFDFSFNYARFLKNRRKIPVLSIVNFILFIIIMQSRNEFMKITLFLVIFTLFANIRLTPSQKKLLKRICFFMGIAVIILFSLRTLNTEKNVFINTIDSFIVDFSGSNYMFSEFYDQVSRGNRLIDSPIILKYMGGFGYLIEYPLRLVGIVYDHSVVNSYLGQGHYIGSSDHYNAFYTMFFEFMNSGGFIGCIIFSIIIGFVVGRLYRKMIVKDSIKSIYTAAFAVYIVAMGTYNYTISGLTSVVILTCLFIANDIDIRRDGASYE
ncbi:O-antigen polymerase [Streptococcus pasteurianus]|uniref:O-antigen polymerase n=1 Tax=Streptococcus pasteurianus TaxID=197614 RepID=UPI0022E1158F|nr:O-antigen polymerase [Streptococcus pasteurianus]